jgi:hypothetical protein
MSMHVSETLEGQIAQRLFGWRWQADASLWRDPDGLYCDAATFRRRLPAYSTHPAATALVWQWVETRGAPLDRVTFEYLVMEEEGLCCTVHCGRGDVEGYGATWPEALCRAALALAEQMENA